MRTRIVVAICAALFIVASETGYAQEQTSSSEPNNLAAVYRDSSSTPPAEPEKNECAECSASDLGVRCNMTRLYLSGSFAPSRLDLKTSSGSNSVDLHSAKGSLGFGCMLTDHFELAVELGGGRIWSKDNGNPVTLLEGAIKPMWHFLPRYRVDPYVGLRLGERSLVGGGRPLNFAGGGPVMGLNYFLNRRVSIYGEAGYSYSRQFDAPTSARLSSHEVTGTVGFSIHFGNGKK